MGGSRHHGSKPPGRGGPGGKGKEPKVRDLKSLEGIGEYVTGEVADAVNHSLEQRGEVAPIGVVLASTDDDVVPAIFGGFNIEPDHLKALLRQKAGRCRAAGVLNIEVDGARVVFKLEHRTLGDLVWRAPITRDKATKVLGPVVGPERNETPTRFLPRRYMN